MTRRRYLGPPNQTIGEIQERVRRVLHPLSPVDMGWPYQCRCGLCKWVKYRGRFYCWNCGRRYPDPDHAMPGRTETFRQAFERIAHEGEVTRARE